MNRYLLLEDGEVFRGKAFGAPGSRIGEVVFTTGMSGYQEAITDQSYNGQLITFTYPLIGNTGINRDDMESINPTCIGVICKDVAFQINHYKANMNLDQFLKEKNIVGLYGIDTRRLTRIIRQVGTMKAMILDHEPDPAVELVLLRSTVLPTDQIVQVSTPLSYPNPNIGRTVVVMDFGLKHSILRELSRRHCNVIVVPYNTSAQDILHLFPDGVMLTNGPGDPKDRPEAIATIRELLGKVPVFGICMGHQLLALACGCDTFKMKFGHRGFNHPVKEIASGRVDFTSQNHGYAVSMESVDKQTLMVTHVEINDQTLEGLRHRSLPAFSVQFHPDAAPGPHDGAHLFDEFMDMMDQWKEQNSWENEQI